MASFFLRKNYSLYNEVKTYFMEVKEMTKRKFKAIALEILGWAEIIIMLGVTIFMFLGLMQIAYYCVNDPYYYGNEIVTMFMVEASCGIFWAVVLKCVTVYFKYIK